MRRTDPKDSKKRFFRAGDRIVNQNSVWYFSSREGDIGPFPTRVVAEQEVQRFLLERQQLSKFQQSRRLASKHLAAKQLAAKRASMQAPETAPKSIAMRAKAGSFGRQTNYHLDCKVEADGMTLTLDDDFLI